jgi:branched-chain amino acid transport system permease protein
VLTDAIVGGLISGSAFAIVALGVSLIFGVANVINFAHGSIFMLGGMLGWALVAELHVPFVAALAIVVVACALAAVIVDLIAVRPLAGASRIAPLLSTLALGLVVDRTSELVFGPQTRVFVSVVPHGNLRIGDVRIAYLDLGILAVAVASVIVLALFLQRSRYGRAIRAAAQDRDAARQMGIDADRMQSIAFAISGALAGIGGVLVGMQYRNVEPSMSASATIDGFAAAALGGFGNLPGAVAGGLLLGIAESLGETYLGGAASQFIAFGVVLLVFAVRPRGLFARGPAPVPAEPLTGSFLGLGVMRPALPWIVPGAAIAAAIVLAFVGSGYVLRTGEIVAVVALVALSLTLVTGTSGVIALGQAGFVAIGAYVTALATTHGVSYWWSLLLAAAASMIVAGVSVLAVMRLRGHDVAIATLAVGSVIVAAILNVPALTGGALGITGIPPARAFGVELSSARDQYLVALVLLILGAAFVARLQRSHLGIAWRAIREDETAAAATAIDPSAYKSLAFVAGALLAAVAGGELAQTYGYVSPDIFGFDLSVLAFTIVVLGGIGNVAGAVLGALLLVGLPEVFRPLHDVRYIADGVVLLVLVRWRPSGLLGYR